MDITPRTAVGFSTPTGGRFIWAMRTSCMSRSNKGFSLIEVAVAVALLSIATAFSLPRVNRLAILAAVDAPHLDAHSAYPQHPAPGSEAPPAAVKVKLINLILGSPPTALGA